MENLLHYPPSTLVNRSMPKKVFYDHWDMPTKMRQNFTDDIASLRWLYKLAADTVNVAAGKKIVEIDVFVAQLKDQDCPDDVFTFIDTHMPRYILFVLNFEDKYRLLLNYKDATGDENHPFRIVKAFRAEWMRAEDLHLTIAGKTLDDVWEHFAGDISGYQTTSSECTHAVIELENLISRKRREAEALQKKIRKERQFNRQIEMNTKARQLKKDIAGLENKLKDIT